MPQFIQIDDQLINLEHVVRAKFEPARPAREGFDDESEKWLSWPARKASLALTLTELELENSFDYEGNVKGSASTNVVVKVHGAPAEIAWDYLVAHAASIAPFVVPAE